MSFADRNTANKTNRTIVLATVAGIHGLVLYGLMTGLGGTYVEKVGAIFEAKNYTLDPLPPPPKVEPVEQAKVDTQIDVIRSPIPLPPLPNRPEFDKPIVLPPIPGPTDTFVPKIEVPVPTPAPTGTPRLAKPRNAPGSWVSTNDYPTAELRNGVQGVVTFEVAIGTDGKVEGCRITSSSGSPGLDAATCRYVTRRARFEPATDASGARVTGTYSSRVTWIIPNN